MHIVRRTDYVNNCMWSMSGCVGCSRAELGHELCALCEGVYTNLRTKMVSFTRLYRGVRSTYNSANVSSHRTPSVIQKASSFNIADEKTYDVR